MITTDQEIEKKTISKQVREAETQSPKTPPLELRPTANRNEEFKLHMKTPQVFRAAPDQPEKQLILKNRVQILRPTRQQ